MKKHREEGPLVFALRRAVTATAVAEVSRRLGIGMLLLMLPATVPATLPAAVLAADPVRPVADLRPGARIVLEFPELPQTLYAMQSEREGTTQACVVLPENYSAQRSFPLFVFLNGGHGGPASGPGRGQQIMQNKDFIFVNLPLFKARLDPTGPFKGLLVTAADDGATICKAYAAMLKKIHAVIPNVDTTRGVIGGMSNGANTIVVIFEQGDEFLMRNFRNLVLIEGGWHAIKTFDRYREKGILYLYGDYAGQNDWLGRKMREDLPRATRRFEAEAAAHRLDVTGIEMEDTGHDMPARFDSDVREWLRARMRPESVPVQESRSVDAASQTGRPSSGSGSKAATPPSPGTNTR